jgi:hypothetical protein
MAGAFGYEAGHYDVSIKMAELSLLPKVREANADALIVAGGDARFMEHRCFAVEPEVEP